MGQKNLAEKLLEDYNDVFADIINALLFDGKIVVLPEELHDTKIKSQYKADDSKQHEQERDIAKLWNNIQFEISLIGIENQTSVDDEVNHQGYYTLVIFLFNKNSQSQKLILHSYLFPSFQSYLLQQGLFYIKIYLLIFLKGVYGCAY